MHLTNTLDEIKSIRPYSIESLKEFIAQTRTTDDEPLIFSVCDSQYAELADYWSRRFTEIGITVPVLFCVDQESYDRTKHSPVDRFLLALPDQLSMHVSTVERSDFPSDKATAIVYTKLLLLRDLLSLGRDAILSDIDAVWMVNPLGWLRRLEYDVGFQPASHPRNVCEVWGATCCTGWCHFRANTKTVELIDAAIASFSGCDQRAMNDVLFEGGVTWNVPLKMWRRKGELEDWEAPVFGRSEHFKLTLCALPHNYFQRHMVTRESVKSAWICHPNSPKNQDGKFERFRELGIIDDEPGRAVHK